MRQSWKRFLWNDEDGSIIILSLFLFVGMAMIGGMALDLARHESTRAHAQAVLDQAVLAATSLDQDQDPKQVVLDWVERAGIEDVEPVVEVIEERAGPLLTGRTVSARLSGNIDTFLMRLVGIDSLQIDVPAQATQRISDIEISLVLDVSGSMAGRKLDDLQEAASDFVEQLYEDTQDNRVSVSIVPYSTQVNAGKALLSQFNVSREHDYSHCVDFSHGQYADTSISTNEHLQRAGHFQRGTQSWNYPLPGDWVCRTEPSFHIQPFASSPEPLRDQIMALDAKGSTSIDIAVKWGLALLDPAARPAISGLISQDLVTSDYAGRPFDFDRDNTMKVLIVMTDGKNEWEYRLDPDYLDGPSGIRRTRRNGDNYYSTREVRETQKCFLWWCQTVSEEQFFWLGNDEDSGDYNWHSQTMKEHLRTEEPELELTWPQIWAEMSVYYFGRWVGYPLDQGHPNTILDDIVERVDAKTKNARTRSACNAAKERGIITYTIGFEVPFESDSRQLLIDCASRPVNYFDVEGLEIGQAFDDIVNSISKLRLTQ
ncbi:Flp pilus assembly protein TadG [Tranquillimonas alkanivorans]|uniref:Flp pilus assembly protein TadG n=2 Tax=Tranquillimonas alkanivorans TaxID=441119 RepID=A0A1I5VSC8_9RHOB|nr:Flp pilus assembly protein TadG [Tranquillimonas alkanivorans]